MARKFETKPGKYAWNPERCEEILIIAAYNEITGFLTPQERWLERDFEYHFYQTGAGIGLHLLTGINKVRKRRNLQPIVLRERACSDYARMNHGRGRGRLRQAHRDELDEAGAEGCATIVANARLEADRLPEPHFYVDEYKVRREIIESSNRASRDEVVRRLAATTAQQQKAIAVDRLARVKAMLSLASDAELRREIVAALPPDEALELAGSVDNAEIRDVLIRHSLSALTAA